MTVFMESLLSFCISSSLKAQLFSFRDSGLSCSEMWVLLRVRSQELLLLRLSVLGVCAGYMWNTSGLCEEYFWNIYKEYVGLWHMCGILLDFLRNMWELWHTYGIIYIHTHTEYKDICLYKEYMRIVHMCGILLDCLRNLWGLCMCVEYLWII